MKPTTQPYAPPDSGKKKIIMIIGVIVILGILALLAGILLPSSPKKQTKEIAKISPSFIPSSTPTAVPTIDTANFPPPSGTVSATPYPGPFYIPNQKQNDLTIKLYQVYDEGGIDQVQLINTKTTETRIIGMTLDTSPGDSAFFSKDFSQVIFLGGSDEDSLETISFYSIPQNKIIKQISFKDIQKALPTIKQPAEAILSRLLISPNGQKLALSYGSTFSVSQIDPKTNIIVIDLKTNSMRLVGATGLVKAWKDDATLQYEQNTSDANNNSVQEVSIQ